MTTKVRTMDELRKRWTDLTTPQRAGVVALAVATTCAQIVMLRDLWHRPRVEVRGPKALWAVASFVRPLGQIAYFRWGRRAPDHRVTDVTTALPRHQPLG